MSIVPDDSWEATGSLPLRSVNQVNLTSCVIFHGRLLILQNNDAITLIVPPNTTRRHANSPAADTLSVSEQVPDFSLRFES